MNYLAKNIKSLRLKMNKSQADIASIVRKRSTAISSWELQGAEPSLSDIDILSDYFGVSASDLIYKDLSDVHLTENSETSKKAENVHGNVHPSVHLSEEKEDEQAANIGLKRSACDLQKDLDEAKETIKTLTIAIKAIDASNAVLLKDIEHLHSVIRLIKIGIPQVGGGATDESQKAVG